MSDNARWYVVHTYSGYENAVKTTIEKFVTNRHLEDLIVEIQIPLETVTEINVRGVTGFVGEANNKPIPLSDEEVIEWGMEKHEIVVGYKVGDTVRISDGPLESFSGIVEEIDAEKNKVTVVVSMFGRETPVEMELEQVELEHEA